jgi:hypothetical protein
MGAGRPKEKLVPMAHRVGFSVSPPVSLLAKFVRAGLPCRLIYGGEGRVNGFLLFDAEEVPLSFSDKWNLIS